MNSTLNPYDPPKELDQALEFGDVLTEVTVSYAMKLPNDQKNDPATERTLTYRFYIAGFEVVSEGSSKRFEWSSVRHFVDGPSGFALYAPGGFAYVIPKRDLPSRDMKVLSALFASRVHRNRPVAVSRIPIGVLVSLGVLVALASWLFLR